MKASIFVAAAIVLAAYPTSAFDLPTGQLAEPLQQGAEALQKLVKVPVKRELETLTEMLPSQFDPVTELLENGAQAFSGGLPIAKKRQLGLDQLLDPLNSGLETVSNGLGSASDSLPKRQFEALTGMLPVGSASGMLPAQLDPVTNLLDQGKGAMPGLTKRQDQIQQLTDQLPEPLKLASGPIVDGFETLLPNNRRQFDAASLEQSLTQGESVFEPIAGLLGLPLKRDAKCIAAEHAVQSE